MSENSDSLSFSLGSRTVLLLLLLLLSYAVVVVCVSQPHTDGPLYYPTVTTVSLGCHAVLDFYTPLESTERCSDENNCCLLTDDKHTAEVPGLIIDVHLESNKKAQLTQMERATAVHV